MAKLFGKIESEKGEIHKIANSELELTVFYGSKDDSRLLLKVSVFAQKKPFDLPEVFIKSNVKPKSYTIENKTQPKKPTLQDFIKESCVIENGLCHTHGFSVSENVKCPKQTASIDFASYCFALEKYVKEIEG